MRKSIIVFVLIIAILLPIGPRALADDTGVCFTAVNDNLLELSVMPTLINGVPYLPYTVFSYLGVSGDYFASASTLMMYQGDLNIFINLETGESYDSDGNTFSVKGSYYGSSIYMPVAWVCGYFGLSYSFINGIGNGDILRIKNSAVVLEDKLFLEYAKSLMKTRYTAYIEAKTEEEKPIIPLVPDDGNKLPLNLNFYGVPSEDFLEYLDDEEIRATFFVNLEELENNQDLIIKMNVLGHQIGFYPVEGSEYEFDEFSTLYFNCLHQVPSFASCALEGNVDLLNIAANNKMAIYKPLNYVEDNSKSFYKLNTKGNGESDLCYKLPFESEKNVESIISYLSKETYGIKLLRETYTL